MRKAFCREALGSCQRRVSPGVGIAVSRLSKVARQGQGTWKSFVLHQLARVRQNPCAGGRRPQSKLGWVRLVRHHRDAAVTLQRHLVDHICVSSEFRGDFDIECWEPVRSDVWGVQVSRHGSTSGVSESSLTMRGAVGRQKSLRPDQINFCPPTTSAGGTWQGGPKPETD
jgi:hypothetical protein